MEGPIIDQGKAGDEGEGEEKQAKALDVKGGGGGGGVGRGHAQLNQSSREKPSLRAYVPWEPEG